MASERIKHTIVKHFILTSNTQATKKKSNFFNFVYTLKGIQCHSSHSPQQFELNKKQQKTKTNHII